MTTRSSRREFLLAATGMAVSAAAFSVSGAAETEPIIDIHQHVHYGGKRNKEWQEIGPARTDEQLVAHQRRNGITKTILLPAGTPVLRASTHEGRSNGLEDTCYGNDACRALALEHPNEFLFGANEVPDLDGAPETIAKTLDAGGIVIAEQKFGVECDSPEMQRLFQLAADRNVPILMHWQFGSYNYGFDRFYKMLEKYPRTKFIGHAQSFWANIDKNYKDDARNLYPKGPVTPGGLTDRYLSDYPNMFGDLSAGSGQNALERDLDHARAFLERHQEKLLYGSDCSDRNGGDENCTGWITLGLVRRLSPSKAVERKLLCENARRVFRIDDHFSIETSPPTIRSK
jgi:predicted TIM-barrel fold metal-dependent hydrolase